MVDIDQREYDVVIVGGGHNGLVAACYLAKAGLRVIVLEQREWLGGMATSRPFVLDAPEHILSPGAWENVYFRAAGVGRELGLEHFGHRDLDAHGWRGWEATANPCCCKQISGRRSPTFGVSPSATRKPMPNLLVPESRS